MGHPSHYFSLNERAQQLQNEKSLFPLQEIKIIMLQNQPALCPIFIGFSCKPHVLRTKEEKKTKFNKMPHLIFASYFCLQLVKYIHNSRI